MRSRFVSNHFPDRSPCLLQARSDAVELKLKVLDDKLLRAQISEEEKLKVSHKLNHYLPAAFLPVSAQPLNEQISRLHEELAAERLSREVMDERKTKEIKAVESGISLDLTAEKRVSHHSIFSEC